MCTSKYSQRSTSHESSPAPALHLRSAVPATHTIYSQHSNPASFLLLAEGEQGLTSLPIHRCLSIAGGAALMARDTGKGGGHSHRRVHPAATATGWECRCRSHPCLHSDTSGLQTALLSAGHLSCHQLPAKAASAPKTKGPAQRRD